MSATALYFRRIHIGFTVFLLYFRRVHTGTDGGLPGEWGMGADKHQCPDQIVRRRKNRQVPLRQVCDGFTISGSVPRAPFTRSGTSDRDLHSVKR